MTVKSLTLLPRCPSQEEERWEREAVQRARELHREPGSSAERQYRELGRRIESQYRDLHREPVQRARTGSQIDINMVEINRTPIA